MLPIQSTKEEIKVYTPQGEGSIFFEGDNVSFILQTDKLSIPKTYVTKIERGSNLPLGKIAVYIEAYDLSGFVHNYEFAMNETNYFIFKKKLGKL